MLKQLVHQGLFVKGPLAAGSRWVKVLWGVALLTVLVGSLWPVTGGKHWFEHIDKLQHAAAYFGLYVLGHWALNMVGMHCKQWRVVLMLWVFGMLIECLQYTTGYRYFSWWDGLANVLGACGGVIFMRLLARWFGLPF